MRMSNPEITLDEIMLVSYQSWVNMDPNQKRKFLKLAALHIEETKRKDHPKIVMDSATNLGRK